MFTVASQSKKHEWKALTVGTLEGMTWTFQGQLRSAEVPERIIDKKIWKEKDRTD